MKCLFVFLMTLGMAMSFPQVPRDAAMDPEESDPMELEDTLPQGKASHLLKVAGSLYFQSDTVFAFALNNSHF